ncbi:MAG: ATP-binding protein [candidate division FCPU426 bacterium]
MFRSRLLWQLIPTYLVLALLSILATVAVSTGLWRAFMREQLQSELAVRGRWVQERLAAAEPERYSEFAKEYAGLAEARITLIADGGEVLADSQADGERLVNHNDRPEVQTARAGQVGVANRFSETLQKRMLYLALPPRPASAPRVVVRLAVPQTNLEKLLLPAYFRMALAALLLALVAAGVSFWVSRRLNRPLVEMGEAAKRFASGDFSQPLWVRAPAEVADLAESLNQMASQLDDRIRLVTRQRQQQEAVFGSLLEGVLALDTGERILEINRFAADLFEVAAERALGRSLSEVARHPDLLAFVGRAQAASEPLEAELVWYAGQERHFQANSMPLKDEHGERRGIVLVLNDITRRRQLDQIRRDFVANVSHELKTPITLVRGFVETLLDGALEDRDEARRFLKIIDQHAKRLDAIIEDLLSLSRLEQAEGTEIGMAREKVALIADRAVAACRSKADAKKIRLECECPPDLEIIANANLLEQAIVNLIDNAIKFSEPKTTIRIAARAEAGSRELQLTVADRGCGIAAEEQERIFERFYRVDKGRSRKEGGTGLGLSIVKHILQVHAGRVTVSSLPGSGSTFTLHLPAAL